MIFRDPRQGIWKEADRAVPWLALLCALPPQSSVQTYGRGSVRSYGISSLIDAANPTLQPPVRRVAGDFKGWRRYLTDPA